MAAKDNSVYSITIGFCGNMPQNTPETVLYGYAKLLLMNESAVKNLLRDDEMADLNKARKFLESKKLDLNLIKSGSLLLQAAGLTKEEQKKYDAFAKYLAECASDVTSVDILTLALETTVIPVSEVYGVGKSMDDIFKYQKVLSRKKGEEPQKKVAPSESKGNEDAPVSKEVEAAKEEAKKAEPNNADFYKISEQYRNLSSALFDVVHGQEQAVSKFVQGCFQGEVLSREEKRKCPMAYFFFFGPPGVGKTLLAETAAEYLKKPHMTFNMSEFASQQSYQELIGTSKIYSNSKEGALVKFVDENPECILVFDEIEKANLSVIRLFLQILGSGKLQNVHKESDTDFTKTIIIFTSNVGKELYADRTTNLSALPEKVIIDAVKSEKNQYGDQVLPNEICSRIASGNTIMFNHLSIRHLAEMANANFEKVAAAMSATYACNITYDSELPLLFLFNRGGEIDARVATSQSGNFLKRELYELSRQIENYKSNKKEISAIHFEIDWDGMTPDLKRLFVNDTKTEVLVLADQSVKDTFKVDEDKYTVHFALSLEEARNHLKKDITAVFIDPFFGKYEENANTLSITDYETNGMDFFYELMDAQSGLPVYLLEVDKEFAEIDRKTFLQMGAAATIGFRKNNTESFAREFSQTLDEVYMQKESGTFSQQGWVISFKTRQDVTADGKINIVFYGLKKRQALDMETRGAVLSEAERPDIKFADVIGAEKAKEELDYFIGYLKNPKRFLVTGGKPPKGVLLYGPPGTGKTMLARAMAGESDVTFIETTATGFMNQYVGESEANIRRVFEKAKKYAPAIIFIDEIDAIGKKRTGSSSAQHTESMLNALLTEMDGFTSDNKKPVFVLAATNYGVGNGGDGIAALDEALMRRFSNKIYVDLPNESERKQYLEMMFAKREGHSVTAAAIDNIAQRTTGQSLSILSNVLELAFRDADKKNKVLTDDDLLSALEDYMYGEKKEGTPEYYRSVAIHEVGHAYVSYLAGDAPSYITIEARGDFGGYMQHGNQEDVPSYSKEDLLARIRTSLAGRAAEQIFYGKDKALNTGASSDLKQATNVAFHIICTYGMEEGQLITLSKEEALKSSLAGDYVRRVNEILDREMRNTLVLIEEGKETIQRIVDTLVSKNHLTGEEFDKLMKNEEI